MLKFASECMKVINWDIIKTLANSTTKVKYIFPICIHVVSDQRLSGSPRPSKLCCETGWLHNTIHSKLKSVFWGTLIFIKISFFPHLILIEEALIIQPFSHPHIIMGKYAFHPKQSNFKLQLVNTASSKLFRSVVFTVRSRYKFIKLLSI